MEYKKHEVLEQKLCKELESLEDKYRGGKELDETDLKRMDLIYHTLKSKATYDAMKMSEEYNMSGASYEYRGGYSGRSMDPGYSGYRGYSGHYPMMPRPYYDIERQW